MVEKLGNIVRKSLSKRAAEAAIVNANRGIHGDAWVAGERKRAFEQGYLAGWRAARRTKR
jgi:hypothetical protein